MLAALMGLPVAAIALFFFWASAGGSDPHTYAAIVRYGQPTPSQAKESYTAVTYNVGYLSGLTNNTGKTLEHTFFEKNQQQAIAALQAIEPDIVSLQEVDFDSARSHYINQAEAIAQGLALPHGAIAVNWDKNYLPFPYGPPNRHFKKMLSGQVILSRYPIEQNHRLVLERVEREPFYFKAFYLDRVAQVSQVALGERSLVVINVHLEAFSETTRISQTRFVRKLAEDYAAKDLPVIVMGDFNSAINRATFTDGGLQQAFQENQHSINEMLVSKKLLPAVPTTKWSSNASSCIATFPSNAPQYKLDYIFYTPSNLTIDSVQVLSTAKTSSDHLPLMVQFRLT